jgi:hypothetical protein
MTGSNNLFLNTQRIVVTRESGSTANYLSRVRVNVVPIQTAPVRFYDYLGSNDNLSSRLWVTYNFDGTVQPANPLYRAISWGADNPAFTWLKFVQGEFPFANGYNPHPGRDHPWSLKAWYKWGARQFHLHMPFGRPYVVNPPSAGQQNYEHLSYQADAYLCAVEGFFDNGILYNAPMGYLATTFERIWKTLITGTKHCTDAEWTSLLQWFDPSDPIKVIVYNGTISKLHDTYENQYPRWSRLFNENYDAALARLKESVKPFINCGMQISLDALAIAPGAIPGQYIPTSQLSSNAQAGWWEFYNWLVSRVGIENLYCEAHPEKRQNLLNGRTDPSPYLGLNVMSAEDWSYFPASTQVSFHKMSELGSVKYLRCPQWGSVGPKTRRINPVLSPARYADLSQYGVTASDGELRIDRLAQNTYFGTAFEHIYAARNLLDRYDQEGDKRFEYNTTKPGYMMNCVSLQEYPTSWGATGTQRFIDRFPTIGSLGQYLNSYQFQSFPTLPGELTL